MTELDFEYLRDVLDNITYWETCPDKDKQRLRLLVKQIDEHRELVKKLKIDDVSKCDNTHCIDGVVDEVYGEKIYCSNCEDK
jgi:hypothetical protein